MISTETFKLHFFLLLRVSNSLLGNKVMKTIGKEPDFTPICTNETSNIIMLIVCWIRTERNTGDECSLLYKDGYDFIHECDSRFRLQTRNHTVFLHLTSLTPADSGNYSCECSNLNGTYFLHLNITVKEDFVPYNSQVVEVLSQYAKVTLPSAVTAAIFLVIVASVIMGFIYRRHQHCACLRSQTAGISMHGSPANIDEANSDKLYTGLQQPTTDIYQTVSSDHHQHASEINSARNKLTVGLQNLKMNSNYNIYENLLTKNVG